MSNTAELNDVVSGILHQGVIAGAEYLLRISPEDKEVELNSLVSLDIPALMERVSALSNTPSITYPLVDYTDYLAVHRVCGDMVALLSLALAKVGIELERFRPPLPSTAVHNEPGV